MFKFALTGLLLLLGTGIELEPKTILEDRVEILIPKSFKIMSDEMLNLKYKGVNKPTLVFSDENGTVNIAFNLLSNTANPNQISAYKDAVKTSYTKSFPDATWVSDGIKIINGKKVAYLKLITNAIDQKVYNSLFLTDCDGRLLVGTFNCIEKLLPEWKDVSDQIVESLKIK